MLSCLSWLSVCLFFSIANRPTAQNFNPESCLTATKVQQQSANRLPLSNSRAFLCACAAASAANPRGGQALMFPLKGTVEGMAAGIIDCAQCSPPGALSKAAQAMRNTHELERLLPQIRITQFHFWTAYTISLSNLVQKAKSRESMDMRAKAIVPPPASMNHRYQPGKVDAYASSISSCIRARRRDLCSALNCSTVIRWRVPSIGSATMASTIAVMITMYVRSPASLP